MNFEKTSIPGLILVTPNTMADDRGTFTKTFIAQDYAQLGLSTTFAEAYYTVSKRGVVRGLHFQKPPTQHAKLVFCPNGGVLDVVVDLRVGSPSYHQALAFELLERGNGLYIPAGCAHGFAALVDGSIVSYLVDSAYSPQDESGILWSSVPVDWPFDEPLVSEKDRALPRLEEFESPFVFSGDRG